MGISCSVSNNGRQSTLLFVHLFAVSMDSWTLRAISAEATRSVYCVHKFPRQEANATDSTVFKCKFGKRQVNETYLYSRRNFLGSSPIWRCAVVLVHRRTRRPSHRSFSVWKFILALFEWKGGARFPGYFKQLKKMVHNFCIIESELIFRANT